MSRLAHLSKMATLEEYYIWLCDLIIDRGHNYNLLLQTLHDKEFLWSVDNDANRAFEAKNLREDFCEETGIVFEYENYNEGVSMLELIIGLAKRCEDIMVDQHDNFDTSEWFWKLLENAGLDLFTDDAWVDSNSPRTIGYKLDNIIERRYQRNGKGGLFPLVRPKKDQREVELWYQMNVYLVDNYYTEKVFV